MATRPGAGSARRARHAFWALVVTAVLATGALSASLAAAPAPATGLRVAASGLVLIGAIGLASRVLYALDRAHREAPEVRETRTRLPSWRRRH